MAFRVLRVKHFGFQTYFVNGISKFFCGDSPVLVFVKILEQVDQSQSSLVQKSLDDENCLWRGTFDHRHDL